MYLGAAANGRYIRAMQTALHITALVAELKQEIHDGLVVSTEFYKKERSAYVVIKGQSGLWALGFVYHPAGPGFFAVPASKVTPETSEKPWPFFEIVGGRITSISQRDTDRIFTFTLVQNERVRHLSFEAIGPNGNIWLLDEKDRKLATLRKREFTEGEPYTVAAPADRLAPASVTPKMLKDRFTAEDPGQPLVMLLEKQIAGFNRTLARETARRAGVEHLHVSDLSDDGAARISDTVREIVDRFRRPTAGYLHSVAGHLEAYPFKLAIAGDTPEKFKTLSLAVLAMSRRRQTHVEDADERKTTLSQVEKAVHKLSRRIEKLQHDVHEAADFERFKKQGELLQINFGDIKRGMTSLAVTDLYGDRPETVSIPLDPALSAKQNVESYFKRYRKGREGLHLLKRRLEISQAELKELELLQRELEANFETTAATHATVIAALRPHVVEKGEVAPRLPYREYKLSTGLTIFVGRDGADNDRTTFEFARPYELWFHASQCPGSHVVIKYPNKSFQPSKAEIEETAAITAFFSKAKNDTLVPVAYTEKRYVRKPRNTKPGLVVIEREKSVMVRPRKPD
ncbi:MAG: NFACT RNA binding domain-containing protein [Candidatus Zixiibacteriota bacterium]